MKPFEEVIITDKISHRTFPQSASSADLVWHRDKLDRWVTVVQSHGWKLQIDNQLPVILENNKTYFIPAKTFHRIIKGHDELSIQIKEK